MLERRWMRTLRVGYEQCMRTTLETTTPPVSPSASEQVELFEDLVGDSRLPGLPVDIGISYDAFTGSDVNKTRTVLDLAM